MDKGDKFRVIKKGAKLTWWVPSGYCSHTGASLALEVGDVVEYAGRIMGMGSDSVPIDRFKKGEQVGEFWPNDWGTHDKSYLEAVQ